tara:strand:+ start:191 stop:349 length:159 start_codon:yes stop_codon:yes gene_type:complete
MPTVIVKGKKVKQFPYNAIGKAQAFHFAQKMGGKVMNNPGYGHEKSMGKKMY